MIPYLQPELGQDACLANAKGFLKDAADLRPPRPRRSAQRDTAQGYPGPGQGQNHNRRDQIRDVEQIGATGEQTDCQAEYGQYVKRVSAMGHGSLSHG